MRPEYGYLLDTLVAVPGIDGKLLDELAPFRGEDGKNVCVVGPAVALVSAFLVLPIVGTILTSLREDGGAIDNYRFALTDPAMRLAFRNNVLWLVLGTGGAVTIGLVVAGLVDRVKREALAKTFVFLPLAISFVGASVIWKFVFDVADARICVRQHSDNNAGERGTNEHEADAAPCTGSQ